MAVADRNRQTRKTRAALLEAFGELVLERRYGDIRVADIIRRADVGRSTFYEHFRDKDDVLRQSVSGMLTALADAVRSECDTRRTVLVLEHFRDFTVPARGMLNGPCAPQVVGLLASLIEERFDVRPATTSLPSALAAAQIAEALLGLVRAWLNRGTPCPAEAVASAMHASATAMAHALFPPP